MVEAFLEIHELQNLKSHIVTNRGSPFESKLFLESSNSAGFQRLRTTKHHSSFNET